MNPESATVFLTFPPRGLGEGERETVRQWLSGTNDIAAAYVSERRGDDPAHYRRVIVVEAGSRQPNYLVHAPDGMDVWLLTTMGEPHPRVFPSLRAALHAIRPAAATQTAAPERPAIDWMGGRPALPRPPVNGAPARTVAEMAAALRRPRGVDSAAVAPRRRQP